MTNDRYGRRIHYLRISLTDMCNLRCVYCMPEDISFRPSAALLQDDEVLRLVRLFAQLGFDKIRLTGGEPTLRENLVPLVEGIAQTPGIREIAMTTNGVLIKHLAPPLRRAGLRRINVSIDTLDPERFRAVTRWGNIDDVLAGIRAAEEAGLEIKLNCVVVRGVNDTDDPIALARLTLEHPWQVRYIEVMPLGSVADFQRAHIVTESDLRTAITAALGPLTPLNEGRLDGEASLYALEDAQGALGFISSVTQPFCSACNRARLTADGKLRLCLLRDKELDLLALMRNAATDEELLTLIKDSIWYKPWGHGLADEVFPQQRVMSEIGG